MAKVKEDGKEKDAIQEMLEAVEYQAVDVAKTIRSMKIIVGATSSDDKSFDHFMSYADKSAKIAENILALRKMAKGESTEEEKEEKPSQAQSPLIRNFGNKQ